MYGAGDQLLSGSRFPQDHHRGIGARYRLYLLKYVSKRGTFSHDFLKIVLRSDLVFTVELFLRQFVLKFSDFLKRQCVIHCDRNLVGHFAEQLQVSLAKCGLLEAADIQGSQKALTTRKWQPASGPDSGVEKQLRRFRRKVLYA